MADLEDRTIASLPQRCESCGATLTEAEKRIALEQETTPVLCTGCAAEAEPATSDPELDA